MGRTKTKGYYKNVYFNALADQIIEDLIKLGEEAIKVALREKGYKNRTYNLHDSIGCAVYFKGNLVATRVSSGVKSKKESREGYTGRDAIRDFFEVNKHISTKNSIHLMLVAAMPYAEYLEKGTHGGHYHIQVISSGTDYIQEHLKEYKFFRPKIIQVAGTSILEQNYE